MSGCNDVQYVPGQFYSFSTENLRGECSNQGVCDDVSGICECNDGWTGLSDFFADPQTDCQISVLGIQILYGIMLLAAAASLIKSRKGLKKRWEDYQNAKAKAKRRGLKYNFWNNRALFCLWWWYVFGFPSLIVACLLRILALEERVGVTPAMTIFFAATKIAFYLSIVVYQPYLFTTLMKGDKITGDTGRFLRFVSISAGVGCGLGVISSFIPFFSIGNTEAAPIVYSAYYIVSGGGLIYNGIVAYLVYKKAEKVLTKSYEQSKSSTIEDLKNRMKKFQYAVVINANGVGIIYIMMFIWPFWWNMHDYFQPLTWLAIIKTSIDQANGSMEGKGGSSKNSSVVGSGTADGKTGTVKTISDDEAEAVSMSV